VLTNGNENEIEIEKRDSDPSPHTPFLFSPLSIARVFFYVHLNFGIIVVLAVLCLQTKARDRRKKRKEYAEKDSFQNTIFSISINTRVFFAVMRLLLCHRWRWLFCVSTRERKLERISSVTYRTTLSQCPLPLSLCFRTHRAYNSCGPSFHTLTVCCEEGKSGRKHCGLCLFCVRPSPALPPPSPALISALVSL
jgi:hypothetical protein